MQLPLDSFQHFAILHPLGFNCRKEVPDFAGALLDSQRAEPHLKAVQDRPQRSWASDNYSGLSLDGLDQPRPAYYFGKQTLDGQEQYAEVRGLRRVQILFTDGSCASLNTVLQLFSCDLHTVNICP